MSQRKALIASILLTLVLAFSAIGIRAAIVDSPGDSEAKGSLPLVVTDGEERDDNRYNDDRDEDDDEDEGRAYASSWDDDDDRDDHEDEDDEEDDDDD